MDSAERLDGLRKAAKCVYLATEAVVADDLSKKLIDAAKHIETLEARTSADMMIDRLNAKVATLEADNRALRDIVESEWAAYVEDGNTKEAAVVAEILAAFDAALNAHRASEEGE